MRILLFGNPSMYHSNLAKGLRELGHEVRLISSRFGWRQFPVDDIQLERRQDINGKLALVDYLFKALPVLRKCKGYDIVEVHHPMFLDLRGTMMKSFYRYIRKHNKRFVMCSVGDDFNTLNQIINHDVLRYSEQKINGKVQDAEDVKSMRDLYLEGECVPYCKHVAKDCDAIVPVLYEYWACYNNVYPEKNHFIPLPVVMPEECPKDFSIGEKVKFFIGLQRERMHVKGTDVMLKAVEDIARDYPELCELQVVENVPYKEYERIMNGSDIILDQLYSYTPSMNSLLAMSKGIVVVGGGEPENYEIIGEKGLRPIINVLPTYQSVYEELKELIHHKERIPELKRQSVEYVRRHHDYRKVAKQYEALYLDLLSSYESNK